MRTPIKQALITILIFFGMWFGLTQIDWVKVLKVQQVTNKTEQKLGEIFWEFFENTGKEISNELVTNSIDSIVTHICKSNNIDRKKIKVHILHNDEINAFALPDGHLIVFSGLILNSDNQEELAGVLCHEIAHIELNHIMKKLVKEIGLSVLISMTTSAGGSEVIKETAKILSSSAFDRGLEKEADIKAVDYLVNAKINPEPFADFLYKIAELEDVSTDYLTWIRTHPDSKERAEYIIEYGEGKFMDYKLILSEETWDKLKVELGS